MKKRWMIWSLLLALLLFTAVARAETAEDVTRRCRIDLWGQPEADIYALRDRNLRSSLIDRGNQDAVLEITPGEAPVAAVFVEFGEAGRLPFHMEAQGPDGGWRVAAAYADVSYPQAILRFAPQKTTFRLVFSRQGKACPLSVTELFLLTEGDLSPDYDHAWLPSTDKADLLVLATHPDDELLWFGGAIPYYAGERGLRVQVAYLTCGQYRRQLELLNGLWRCGVRNYPDIGGFFDFPYESLREVYGVWGKEAVDTHIVRLLRRYRPEVVLAQDEKGEYGHFEHIACVQSLLRAVELAADASCDPQSLQAYGAWQVKKVYVHLGEEPTLRMDWDVPLEAFEGKTAFEVAEEAFACHLSQQGYFHVARPGDPYDAEVFTLKVSCVGPDVRRDDFFENIPADCLSVKE